MSNVVNYIHDLWKARSLEHGIDEELEFCENRINLNHVLEFDPFLNDLIDYDTLKIISEVVN